jgi:hypothetical protein
MYMREQSQVRLHVGEDEVWPREPAAGLTRQAICLRVAVAFPLLTIKYVK